MMNGSIQTQLRRLCAADTTEAELSALQALNVCLARSRTHASDPDLFEEEFLSQSKSVLEAGNPYPSFQVTDFNFPDSVVLTDFVHYLLTRRYGWSEVMPDGSAIKVQRIHGVGSSSIKEATLKTQLNELLDEFLKWLLCQRLSHELISSLKYSVHQASNHPVIRKQTFIHILEWFRSKCTVFHEEYFEQSKELIILGLTDVWSAIRSACASKLHIIAEQFNVRQIEDFFLALVQICESTESSWQAKEGAIMGIGAIIRRFQWVGFNHDESVDNQYSSSSLKTEYFLKFGREELQKIPEFISTQLNRVIYTLLADPQLSIREHTIKAFSSYLSRCDLKEALSSFNEVVTRLCEGTGLTEKEMIELEGNIKPVKIRIQSMDAYLAEGLLGMSISLIKRIAMESLMPVWSLCMNTFTFYLMHPASTVRQAASKVIKFLVAKDTSKPRILTLVLSSLTKFWLVDNAVLIRERLPDSNCECLHDCGIYYCENQVNNSSISDFQLTDNLTEWCRLAERLATTWEWREGRLLAYELIFQFLIKNHWLYTFGAATKSVQHESKVDSDKERLRPLQSYGGAGLQNYSPESFSRTNLISDKFLDLRGNATRSHSSLSNSPRAIPLRPSNYPALRPSSPRLHPGPGSNKPNRFPVTHGFDEVRFTFRHSPRLEHKPRAGMPFMRMPLKRRATMDHVNAASLTTYVKHYSYYQNPKETHQHQESEYNLSALPLITTIKHLEVNGLKQEVESSKAIEGDKRLFETNQEKMPDILTKILVQTIECIDSTSWELKRMSHQVLPCLVEVIRWYDMAVLEGFWSEHISDATSVMAYGASMSFLHSIVHATKLIPLRKDPPDTWQNIESCRRVVKNIVDSMKTQIQKYIPVFCSTLKRSCIDRLSIVALRILITCISFSKNFDQFEEAAVSQSVRDAVKGVQLVVLTTNPTSRLYKKMMKPERHILIPASGFLSCNPLESGQMSVTLQHLERNFIEQMCDSLVTFVKQEDIAVTYEILPCMALLLRKQISADSTLKALHDSVITLLDHLSLHTASDIKNEVVYHIKNDCFFELLQSVTGQPTNHILNSSLESLLALLKHADSSRFLLPLLRTICSKHSNNQEPRSYSRLSNNNLEILSNDIKETDETTAVEDSESDDDIGLNESDHLESLALHSSGGASGRQSSMSQYSISDGVASNISRHSDDEENSDWDSWSESENDSSDSDTVYQDFLAKLYQNLMSQGRSLEMTNAIQKLPNTERQIIKALIQLPL